MSRATRWWIGLAALCFIVTSAHAEIPRTVGFQGKLTDQGGQPLDGAYQVTFRLYDASTGGTRLWEENQTLTVAKGLFSTSLGSAIPLTAPFDQPYWVEIQVATEILAPRLPLTSSPYALRAQQLDGLTMTSGNVGIGTATPQHRLHVIGKIHASSDVCLDNGSCLSTVQSGGVSGAGTPGHLSKWTSSSALGDSPIAVQANGNVGIGTSAPGYPVDVRANANTQLHIASSSTDAGGYVGSSSDSQIAFLGGASIFNATHNTARAPEASMTDMRSGQIRFSTNDGLTVDTQFLPTERMRIEPSGDVGIGTSVPGYILDVRRGTDGDTAINLANNLQASSGSTNETLTILLSQGHPSGGDALKPGGYIRSGKESDYTSDADVDSFLAFATAQSDTDNERMRITAAGNVGIGTTDPSQKLEVAGGVRFVPSGAPANPSAGTVYFSATDKHFYGFDGTTWKQLDN